MMDKVHDEVLLWKRLHSGIEAMCQVQIFKGEDGTLVILTEHPGNPGVSVTNGVELIAAKVCKAHALNSADVIWIEHYARNFAAEDWSQVRFRTNGVLTIFGASWEPSSWANVSNIIGTDKEWDAI